jgi:hypothetical protein
MKKLVAMIVLLVLSFNALADCNWATDIKPVSGGFLYSKECHEAVGGLIQDNKRFQLEIGKLNESIATYDLALKKSEDRANNWMDASIKAQEQLQKFDHSIKLEGWLAFGAGVVFTSLAVFGAGYLHH